MSRSIHSGVKYAGNHRTFRNMNHRRTEMTALEEITDAGVNPSNRLRSFWSRIPDVFDDFSISANDEFFGKSLEKTQRDEKKNRTHWTRN